MVNLDPAFVRYERIVSDSYKRFDTLVQDGEAKPLLVWQALLPGILPLTALLIPRQKGGWIWRPILQAVTFSLCIEIMRYRRALLGGNGYIVGLMMVWWLVWSSTLLFFNDAERDFRRIERVRVTDEAAQQDGPMKKKQDGLNEVKETEMLVWQPYPRSLKHRLGWAFALVLNMRGPDFSFRISSLDPLPPQLDAKAQPENENYACPQARARIKLALKRFFVTYLILDMLKTIIILDPYFFGVSGPPPFPLNHLSAFPGLIRAYHSLVSGVSVYYALLFVTALNPIAFLGLSTAFPNASRAITKTPLDAPWLYADQFGTVSTVLDEGLAGAWGKWWHQIFRFGFVSSAKYIISFLPTSITSRRTLRRIITTLVAFAISGTIHGAGSYTQLGEHTRPVSGTFLFFMLQGVGIFVEDICSRFVLASSAALGLGAPRWLRRLGNMAFVLGWLFISGTRIADDFARGGMWLTEPLPFSLIRGLMGRGWLCWRIPWFEYYDDGTFWGRGLRVV